MQYQLHHSDLIQHNISSKEHVLWRQKQLFSVLTDSVR